MGEGGTKRVEDYTFFYGQGNGDHQGCFFIHKRIVSTVRRVEFISDRMPYTILRGRWCNIFVLNVHAPCEDKGDDMKDSFYEELGRVFDRFPRYDMKILLGDLNAKVGRENIFKPTIGNERLHEISNENGRRIANFATHLRTWLLRLQCSLIAKFINTPGPLLRETHTTRLITF
jgi:hypothetical protein